MESSLVSFDINMMINFDDTLVNPQCDPLIPSLMSAVEMHMPLILSDNNPFDLLSHCSDNGSNDPFESVFHSAETYSPPIEEQVDKLLAASSQVVGNILLDCAKPADIECPRLVPSSICNASQGQQPEGKILTKRESVKEMVEKEDKQKIRDLIRQRVLDCIKSAVSKESKAQRSDLLSSDNGTLMKQQSNSYSFDRYSVGSDSEQSDTFAQLNNARFFSTESELSSISSQQGWKSKVSTPGSRAIRLASVPTVVDSSLRHIASPGNVFQRSYSDPCNYTPQAMKEEANSLATLFICSAELGQSPDHDSDDNELEDDVFEDDKMLADVIRRISFSSAKDDATPSKTEQTIPQEIASKPTLKSGFTPDNQFEPTKELVLSGRLANKHLCKPTVKQGPMRATMPMNIMVKSQGVKCAPPLLIALDDDLNLPTTPAFYDVANGLHASSPYTVPRKTQVKPNGLSKILQAPKPRTIMRRSSSGSCIPSPVKQGIPSPMKRSIPMPVWSGNSPPVKRGIPLPSKSSALKTKMVNLSGYGTPLNQQRSNSTSDIKGVAVKGEKENVKPHPRRSLT